MGEYDWKQGGVPERGDQVVFESYDQACLRLGLVRDMQQARNLPRRYFFALPLEKKRDLRGFLINLRVAFRVWRFHHKVPIWGHPHFKIWDMDLPVKVSLFGALSRALLKQRHLFTYTVSTILEIYGIDCPHTWVGPRVDGQICRVCKARRVHKVSLR